MTKTAEAKIEKAPPKIGDVIEQGTLDDGRPFHDIYLADGKTYRLTRILVSESDAAWDASQGEDDTFNPRLNNRMKLASSIFNPKTTVDDFDRFTEIELAALFRGYNRLNTLPFEDGSGNA